MNTLLLPPLARRPHLPPLTSHGSSTLVATLADVSTDRTLLGASSHRPHTPTVLVSHPHSSSSSSSSNGALEVRTEQNPIHSVAESDSLCSRVRNAAQLDESRGSRVEAVLVVQMKGLNSNVPALLLQSHYALHRARKSRRRHPCMALRDRGHVRAPVAFTSTQWAFRRGRWR